jgi:hypothetical protein
LSKPGFSGNYPARSPGSRRICANQLAAALRESAGGAWPQPLASTFVGYGKQAVNPAFAGAVGICLPKGIATIVNVMYNLYV